MKKLFDPECDLMSTMSNLSDQDAGQWYREYLEYHKGVDQGVEYLVGYFPEKRARKLRKLFGIN